MPPPSFRHTALHGKVREPGAGRVPAAYRGRSLPEARFPGSQLLADGKVAGAPSDSGAPAHLVRLQEKQVWWDVVAIGVPGPVATPQDRVGVKRVQPLQISSRVPVPTMGSPRWAGEERVRGPVPGAGRTTGVC